jgi:hypothetical protein
MSLMDNVKQLDTKQKGMLVATIGCLGLVFYLAYTTFFASDGGPAPAPVQQSSPPPTMATASAPPSVTSAPQPIMTPTSDTTGAPTGVTDTSEQESEGQNVQIGHAAPASPQNLALLAQSQQMQQQYIQLVNEYQLAQLQQKLAQVDSQIAASKLTTTKSLVELKKLQPLLGSDMGGPSATTSPTSTSSASAQQGYQTMYVGAVAGKWQAMLEGAGQYFQVTVGMRLPDGSVVSQINNRGVVLTNASGTPVFLPMAKSLD